MRGKRKKLNQIIPGDKSFHRLKNIKEVQKWL